MDRIIFSGHQPNFLPYMGFFYKIFKSDIFVFDDDVQYTNKEYANNDGVRIGHNSNAVIVGEVKGKIIVPVSYRFGDKINEVRISYASNWKDKMLKTIRHNYNKHPHFDEMYMMLENALNHNYEFLYDLNRYLLDEIINGFGFRAKIVTASIDVPTELKNNDRNIYQCKTLGANVYYSGTGGGRLYNDEESYKKNKIDLIYSDYEPKPYKQHHRKKFIENLSVIDYLFNCGYTIPEGWGR